MQFSPDQQTHRERARQTFSLFSSNRLTLTQQPCVFTLTSTGKKKQTEDIQDVKWLDSGKCSISIFLSLPFNFFNSVFSVSTVFLLTGLDDVLAAEPVAVCFVPFNSATLCKEVQNSGLQLKIQRF